MAGPLVPVIVGGRVLQLAAPRAMELLRSGAARMLPGMRTVGGQSAGPNAAGPFYQWMGTNAARSPAPWSPLVATGVLGAGAAGNLLSGDPRETERSPAAARPLTIPASGRGVQSDINYDRSGLPDDALGGWPVIERALDLARREDPPPPPPRPREEAPVMRGDYQSMNDLADGPERGYGARVIQGDRINWGDADSAADFFRADRAMRDMGRANGGRVDLMQMANEAMNLQMARRQAEEGMKAQSRAPRMADGGGVPSASGAPGNDKVLEHAMAIIRHLITKG
jgi:hypothetical protein